MKTKKKPRSPRPSSKQQLQRKTKQSSVFRDLVRNNILFSHVHPRTVVALTPKLSECAFRTGQVIFDESTRGRHLYLILRGQVRITKCTRVGLQPRLAVLHEGDFFGELAVIDGMPRSARAEAMLPCIIALFEANDFRRLVTKNRQFAFNVLLNLAIRLRTLDQTFVYELEKSVLAAQMKMDKLNLLIDASKTVNSTIELDQVLDLILDSARRSIKADRGTLYLIDDETNELWSKSVQGEDVVEIRLPIGKGLAGYVAETGETVNIRDAYADPRFNPEIDKKSGYKTQTVLCAPMRDKEGKILGAFQFLNKIAGVFTDEDESFIAAFSVHASIALNNARLVRETVQSERLAAVGRMASQIIHDIRGPMASLRLYAEMIKKKSKEDDVARMSDQIMQQVDRSVRMAQEILDFSRGVSEIKKETVATDELLSAGLELVETELSRKRVQLVRDVRYHGTCNVDMNKMVRVFYNIARNAMDAMSEDGTFTVRLDRNDQSLLIEFADSGGGIPDEIKARIFEPFFTFGKRKGTGLGLAIVKKVVDDHGGSIQIESRVNVGTTIRILLPLADDR
jgi:signal transduction histidine kinase/CRP-like cAMP-binding protein